MSHDTTSELFALISFTLPQSRLDHDESVYLTYDANRARPLEDIRVPLVNLRGEVEGKAGFEMTPWQQLYSRGFAVAHHVSRAMGDIPSPEGTEAYLNETAEKNDKGVKVKDVPKQQAPEKGFVPTTRLQPVASQAHVDQNETWGYELVGKAAGKPASDFKRAMIVNLWRPLHGPVTNAPLAMVDSRTLAPADMSVHASQFGLGIDLHHSPSQSWSYIRHQMPDEVIILKCYDTAQGSDGSALYCGHVAVQVDMDEAGINPGQIRPRESVEVRCVALWE